MHVATSQTETSDFRAPRVRSGLPLRVLIDGRKLGHGGIGVYLDNLIEGLLSLSGELVPRVGVVASSKIASEYHWSREVEIISENAQLYSFDELFRLASRLPLDRYDVFHVPHFTLPFRVPIPSVVTVHDLIHVHFPERYYYPWLAKPLLRSAMRRADRIITVSHASAQDLRTLSGNNAWVHAKLRVIPNAIWSSIDARSEVTQGATETQFPQNYLLVVASLHKPHKCLFDVVQAFQQNRKLNSQVSLVVVGKGSIDLARDLEKRNSDMTGIYFLGEVPREILMKLYKYSVALVVPSRAEGFCLPAIEAQAMGVPVVARPIPALKEILSANDILCQDESLEALRAGMQKALQCWPRNQSQQQMLEVRAEQVIQKYDRTKIARDTLLVYEEAVLRV